MLIRAQCICKTQPWCSWGLGLVSDIPTAGLAGNPMFYHLVLTFPPVLPWPASGWSGANGSTALFSRSLTRFPNFAEKQSCFPIVHPCSPFSLPPCGLWAGIGAIDGNLCPGGVRQGYPEGSGTLTKQLPLIIAQRFPGVFSAAIVKAHSGYFHYWPAIHSEMLHGCVSHRQHNPYSNKP